MHVIRLRTAWEPWSGSESAEGFSGFQRPFHCPTGLEGGARVYLVIEPACAGPVLLNDAVLAPTSTSATFRCDITDLLRPRNQLVIVEAVAETAPPHEFPWQIRLEIVEP